MTTVLTAKEVAEMLDYTPHTVYVKARNGEIPAFRMGRNIRFRADEIDAWIAAQPPVVTPPRRRRRPA